MPIGFGPALFKHTKKNGEIFSVRALPLGGYCAFEGEDEDKDDPAAFNNKKPWQRIIVLISGALMNYILAVLVIIVSFFACGQLLLMTLETEDSSYTAAGNYIESEYKFQDRDVIIACEGKNIYLTSDLMDALEGLKDGELAKFKISRVFEDGRKIVEVEIMMRADADFSGMTDTNSVWECIGVAKQLSEDGETYTYKMASTAVKGFGFFETIGRAFTYSIRIAGTLFRVLGELLTGALGLSAFGGPITTIRMTSAIATLGVGAVLRDHGAHRRESRGVQPLADPCARRFQSRVHDHRVDTRQAGQPQSGGGHPHGGIFVPHRVCDLSGYFAIVLEKTPDATSGVFLVECYLSSATGSPAAGASVYRSIS